jgi:hypothetical protein
MPAMILAMRDIPVFQFNDDRCYSMANIVPNKALFKVLRHQARSLVSLYEAAQKRAEYRYLPFTRRQGHSRQTAAGIVRQMNLASFSPLTIRSPPRPQPYLPQVTASAKRIKTRPSFAYGNIDEFPDHWLDDVRHFIGCSLPKSQTESGYTICPKRV